VAYLPTLDSIYYAVDLRLTDSGGIAGTRFDAFEEELYKFCVETGNINKFSRLVSYRLDGENHTETLEEVSRLLYNRAVYGKSYSTGATTPEDFVSKLSENTRERLSLYLDSCVEGLQFLPTPNAKTLSIQCPADFDHTPYGTVVQVGLETFFRTRMGRGSYWISSTGTHYTSFEFFDFLVKKVTLGEPLHCLYTI
jgi:hypothetical protein